MNKTGMSLAVTWHGDNATAGNPKATQQDFQARLIRNDPRRADWQGLDAARSRIGRASKALIRTLKTWLLMPE